MAVGFTIREIMIHGDWSHPDSVINCYAVGGVPPSIAINDVRGGRRRNNASPGNGPGVHVGPVNNPLSLRPVVVAAAAAPAPRGFAATNAFVLMAEIGRDEHSVAARSDSDAARLKRGQGLGT
jgi:hypothetical protein